MMMRYFSLLICLFDINQAKICWKECGSKGVIESTDVIGCKRRSTYPSKQDFRCEGYKGPPCFVERGDTALVDVVWNNPGVANMTQSVTWVTWIEMPWVGLETEACPFLDGGQGCRKNANPSKSKYQFPIYVQTMYPTGNFDLKYKFWERLDSGEEREIACFLFTMKII